jgi:hypothetical protein
MPENLGSERPALDAFARLARLEREVGENSSQDDPQGDDR